MNAEDIDRLLEQIPSVARPERSRLSTVGASLPTLSVSAQTMLGGVVIGQRVPSANDTEQRVAAARLERRADALRQRERLWPRVRHAHLASQLRASDTPCGLLLGPTGIGKTSAARWLGVRYPGVWVHARELGAAERHHALGEGWAPLMKSAIGARHLYLDDLGTEEARDLGALQFVIDQRYAAGRATFATSGLTKAELASYLGAPYVRRLIEQHVPLPTGGELAVLVVDCHPARDAKQGAA
jgi:hypothetical protein